MYVDYHIVFKMTKYHQHLYVLIIYRFAYCANADANLFFGRIPGEIGELYQLEILNLCKFE